MSAKTAHNSSFRSFAVTHPYKAFLSFVLPHASFNASNTYRVFEFVTGVMLITLAAAGYRKIKGKSVV